MRLANFRLLGVKVSSLTYYFITYSFIGWCIETAYMSVDKGHYVSRGFLTGPFCAIYGFGALLLILFLRPLRHNIMLFFLGASLLTSILEYMTGLILETAFDRTWWDYSKIPFNLQGRICLRNTVIWGILAVFIMYVLHPFIRRFVFRIPEKFKSISAYFIIIYFLLDSSVVTASLKGIIPDLKQLYLFSQRLFGSIFIFHFLLFLSNLLEAAAC